jgi:chromosome segregation ATPase
MTMDLGQLTQMTTWLDEEHRRSKAELIQLQQTIVNAEGELRDQARTIKDLEGRLAGMQTQLLKSSQLQAAMQQLREEVVHLLAQADDRRQQEDREAERLRAIERDNVSRAVNEIRRDLQRLPRIEEESKLRKAEQQRMGESVLAMQQSLNTLAKDVENKVRSIPFLEDGRQQDAKRIAQLQQESLEALKRLEQQGSRLQMIEDAVPRQERDAAELKEMVSQLRTLQRDSIEKQLLETEQFKRQMAEWGERMAFFEKKFTDFAARMETFDTAFREDRQVVESVERFQEAIKREQAQVSELQRLAEERQRRQLEEWQEENEKRWRKELLRWEHQWGEQAKRNGQISETFGDVQARLSQHRVEIDAAWKFLESQVNYQIQETRRWSGEMNRILEERPKKK